MPRNLTYALLLFIGALACTKEPPACVTGTQISLYATADRTKSIVRDCTLPESYTIYASAFYTNPSVPDEKGNYFIAAPFRNDGGQWTADPAILWPVGGRLDFISIACEDEALDIAGCAGWHEGNCSEGVEVTLGDGGCLNSEILFASACGRTAEGGGVPLNFKHAQCWLQFIVNIEQDIIRIDKIVLEGVYTGGLLSITNNIRPDARWSFRGHRRTDKVVPGSEGLIPTAGTPSVCNILVPEQDECDIAIYYSVKTSPSDDWSSSRNCIYRHKSGNGSWFYGDKNTLTVIFSFTEITMTARVGEWTELDENLTANIQ